MNDIFLTLSGPSEGLYKEKGSKFLAFAYPVRTEAEVKVIVQQLRKKYYDARHHCFAYRLGPTMQLQRSNDDGEPNHSAGDPILGQIKAKQLTDVLVVVVRYFGGIKLGVGGLVYAYKTAAQDALDQAQVIEKTVQLTIKINFAYEQMNDVMKVLKEVDASIISQAFDNACEIEAEVQRKFSQQAIEKLQKIDKLSLYSSNITY